MGLMNFTSLATCLVVQLCLAFGMTGLLWPDKLMPLFSILMFPWSASHRTIWANSLAAIGVSLLLFVRLLAVF